MTGLVWILAAVAITACLLAVEWAETGRPRTWLRQQLPLAACALPITVATALMTYADTASAGDWIRWLVVAGPIVAAAGFVVALRGGRR